MNAVERCRGNLTALKEQIAGKEKIAVDSLKIRIQELEKEQQQRENEEKELFGMRKNNQKCLKTMEELQNLREKLLEEYQAVDHLNRTANGSLAQTGHAWIFRPICRETISNNDDSGGKPQAGADEPGAVYSGM